MSASNQCADTSEGRVWAAYVRAAEGRSDAVEAHRAGCKAAAWERFLLWREARLARMASLVVEINTRGYEHEENEGLS